MPKGSALKSQQSPDLFNSLFSMRSFEAERDLPIVYNCNYNMRIFGIELAHNFDTKKYAKIAGYLSELFRDTLFAREKLHDEVKREDDDDDDEDGKKKMRKLRYLSPNRPVNKSELGIHHSQSYIEQIHIDKSLVARITETWVLNLLPLSLIESRLLTPIKWQLAGTIFAFHLAMQHGWAINLGGGFHVGSADYGETFCLFSDIFLAIKYVWRKHPLQKFMIIDADAHQATGIERDLSKIEAKKRKNVYMIDIFNGSIQPPDPQADKGIDLRVELGRFVGDATYIAKLRETLNTAFTSYKPTMIIYIAGQDVLVEDSLGLMNLSDDALKLRDEIVFSFATEKLKCPIVMVLGGGYLVRGAKVQAESIRSMFAKGLIWGGYRSGSRSLSRPRQTAREATGTNSSSKSCSKKKTTTITKSGESQFKSLKASLSAKKMPQNIHKGKKA